MCHAEKPAKSGEMLGLFATRLSGVGQTLSWTGQDRGQAMRRFAATIS
jgi:hypothetical protein